MIGKVARCRKGMIGLILRIRRPSPPFKKPLYIGICLDSGKVGQAWQSLDPELIGTLDDWVRIRHFEIGATEQAQPKAAVAKCCSLTPTKRNLLT